MTRSTWKTTLALAGIALFLSSASAVGRGTHGLGMRSDEALDKNQDGRISLQESQDRRAEVFASLDDDKDGSLTIVEYLNFGPDWPGSRWVVSPSGTLREARAVHFAEIDDDDNERVTRQEYLDHARARFVAADSDGDGYLTRDDRR